MPITGSTINSIYEALVTEQKSMTNLASLTQINSYQDLLQSLTTTSNVSVTNLLNYTHAYLNWLLENNMVNLYNELETLINRTGYGSSSWWNDKVLEFQTDSLLVVDPITYQVSYETTDITKQVIKSCAVLENANGVLLKVRRKDTDLLSTEELSQLYAYVAAIKIAGIRTAVLNIPSDTLKIQGQITYNAQLGLDTVKANVEAAITNYIETLEFNSQFVKAQLIENVMAITGIKNFNITLLESKDYVSAYETVNDTYEATSGYLEIDGAYPLSSNISYVAIK